MSTFLIRSATSQSSSYPIVHKIFFILCYFHWLGESRFRPNPLSYIYFELTCCLDRDLNPRTSCIPWKHSDPVGYPGNHISPSLICSIPLNLIFTVWQKISVKQKSIQIEDQTAAVAYCASYSLKLNSCQSCAVTFTLGYSINPFLFLHVKESFPVSIKDQIPQPRASRRSNFDRYN